MSRAHLAQPHSSFPPAQGSAQHLLPYEAFPNHSQHTVAAPRLDIHTYFLNNYINADAWPSMTSSMILLLLHFWVLLLIFLSKASQIHQWKPFLVDLHVLLNVPMIFGAFPVFYSYTVFQVHLVISLYHLWNYPYHPAAVVSLSEQYYLEISIWELALLTDSGIYGSTHFHQIKLKFYVLKKFFAINWSSYLSKKRKIKTPTNSSNSTRYILGFLLSTFIIPFPNRKNLQLLMMNVFIYLLRSTMQVSELRTTW